VVLRRLVQMAAMLAVLSVGLFYLLHAMPGDPLETLLASNPELQPEDIARIKAQRGLDRPIHERYWCWLVGSESEGACAYWPSKRGITGGDLGWSEVHRLPVSELLGARLATTLSMMIPALVLALALAVPLGVLAARRRGQTVDRLVSLLTFAGVSLPAHWLALIAVLVFAVGLRWLPPSGIRDVQNPSFASWIEHAVLPVLVLAVLYGARWTRYVRASTLEVLELDFVHAARAKGLRERDVLLHHVLPNALLPLITVVSQAMPALFSGALIVERVFAYPGMGILLFESVEAEDHLVAIVVFLAYAAVTMLAAFTADVAYAAIDPRIRVGRPIEERAAEGGVA
jgi:peptide/nickel transport system permease protein